MWSGVLVGVVVTGAWLVAFFGVPSGGTLGQVLGISVLALGVAAAVATLAMLFVERTRVFAAGVLAGAAVVAVVVALALIVLLVVFITTFGDPAGR